METMAWMSLAVAGICALVIAADEVRRPQKMAIMNIVWPVTALYLSVIALWTYFAVGVKKSKAEQKDMDMSGQGKKLLKPMEVAVATSHCGAGCALADVAVEFTVSGLVLTLFGLPLWASFVYDLIAAWSLGIVFQYFSIQPMRHLPPGQALVAAIKADTLSILCFQVGMYAFMALNWFVLAPRPRPDAFDPRFWLMMQIGMILGFATAYPMNWFLLKKGLKERM